MLLKSSLVSCIYFNFPHQISLIELVTKGKDACFFTWHRDSSDNYASKWILEIFIFHLDVKSVYITKWNVLGVSNIWFSLIALFLLLTKFQRITEFTSQFCHLLLCDLEWVTVILSAGMSTYIIGWLYGSNELICIEYWEKVSININAII